MRTSTAMITCGTRGLERTAGSVIGKHRPATSKASATIGTCWRHGGENKEENKVCV